jgi:hypothetical protein
MPAVRRTALILMTAVAAALLAAGVAGAFKGRVFVASNNCNGHAFRPSRIDIACGTGGFYVNQLHYSAYGAATASATGRLWINQCRPNCALGTFKSYAERITLTHVSRCQGRLYYFGLAWRSLHPAPASARGGTANVAPDACAAVGAP